MKMKNRIKAASTHLLLSALLISTFAGLTLFHFYPGIFFNIENTSDALKILIPADIIIGPVLTLLIYVKGKKGLKLDLYFIAACQISTLLYGCWSIYQARPGFLVFHGDAFYITPPRIDQSKINVDLKVGFLSSPKITQLIIPGSINERFKNAMESVNSGIPVHWQSQYYFPLNKQISSKYEKANVNINKLKENTDNVKILEEAEKMSSSHYLIPVVGTRSSQIIAIDKKSLSLDKVLNIFPF